ncbi:DUF3105 domain-containing protein [Streptomyces sp. NPDC001848]|uniref:DUF3105 domain-containing protein n=1 Tax=Streptomyces sp. NPDC001848 TaxID=3364618 RepID=UPI0036973714
MTPPVGGDPTPVRQNRDGEVYSGQILDDNAVHAMEHGAVWGTHNDNAARAHVTALAAMVAKRPYTLKKKPLSHLTAAALIIVPTAAAQGRHRPERETEPAEQFAQAWLSRS